MKKKFTIQITETLSTKVEVYADTVEEARNIVEDMYKAEQLILSADDFVEYNIK